MLWAGHFCRVETAVDVDERLPFARELARRGFGQRAGMREPTSDLPIAIQSGQVVRRRDEREIHRPLLARRPGLHEFHELRRRGDTLEVLDRLIVGGELVIGPGFEAEHRLGRRDATLAEHDDGCNEQGDERQVRGESHPASICHPHLANLHARDSSCGGRTIGAEFKHGERLPMARARGGRHCGVQQYRGGADAVAPVPTASPGRYGR